MADEASSHNVEQMPICFRFVNEKCDIREDFMTFVRLERVRASDITKVIVDSIEGLGLSLNELRGQGLGMEYASIILRIIGSKKN